MNGKTGRSNEACLVELESRLALQDQAINDLSQEIYKQQKQLEQIQATCNYLLERSREMRAAADDSGDETPPHY